MPGSPPNPGNGYRDTCSGVKTAVTYRQNGPWCSDIVAPPYQNEGETPRNETDHQRIEDQAACMLCPRPYQTPSNEPRSHPRHDGCKHDNEDRKSTGLNSSHVAT